MARNHKFFFDTDGVPRARGPTSERLLMHFLENDVQNSDQVCHDLLEDLVAIEDGSDSSREFIGNAHALTLTPEGIELQPLVEGRPDDNAGYRAGLKHFREVLEDWEAFILDDQMGDPLLEDDLPT